MRAALAIVLLVALRADGGLTTASLDADVRAFLDRELAAHLGDIASFEPPPDRVLGAQTTGEYTWGTFMRSLAAYAQLTGSTHLAGRDLVRTIADIGLLEVRLGGSALGRGTRGAVPLHLVIDSTDLRLQPGAPRSWTVQLRVEAP